jgi:hypothetical protein
MKNLIMIIMLAVIVCSCLIASFSHSEKIGNGIEKTTITRNQMLAAASDY